MPPQKGAQKPDASPDARWLIRLHPSPDRTSPLHLGQNHRARIRAPMISDASRRTSVSGKAPPRRPRIPITERSRTRSSTGKYVSDVPLSSPACLFQRHPLRQPKVPRPEISMRPQRPIAHLPPDRDSCQLLSPPDRFLRQIPPELSSRSKTVTPPFHSHAAQLKSTLNRKTDRHQ